MLQHVSRVSDLAQRLGSLGFIGAALRVEGIRGWGFRVEGFRIDGCGAESFWKQVFRVSGLRNLGTKRLKGIRSSRIQGLRKLDVKG